MLPTAELAIIGKLANDPQPLKSGNGVVLHLLIDGLGKRDGQIEAAWVRTTVFGDLARTALASFRKGDSIFARGAPTLDKWKGKGGEAAAGLSMVASEAVVLGIVLRPPEEAPYVPPSARAEETADTLQKATTKPASARPKVAMEGGLPKGQKTWSAIRVRRDDWQAPSDWIAPAGDVGTRGTIPPPDWRIGDNIDDIFTGRSGVGDERN